MQPWNQFCNRHPQKDVKSAGLCFAVRLNVSAWCANFRMAAEHESEPEQGPRRGEKRELILPDGVPDYKTLMQQAAANPDASTWWGDRALRFMVSHHGKEMQHIITAQPDDLPEGHIAEVSALDSLILPNLAASRPPISRRLALLTAMA